MRKITWLILFCASALSLMTAQAVTVNLENMKAGGLKDSLKARGVTPQSVEHLTISGELNGTDIRLIRNMGGSDEHGKPLNDYLLVSVDLSKARIVEGGSFYIEDDKGIQYSTRNNVWGDYQFAFCKKLKHVVFPEEIESIGKGGFLNCDSLLEVRFADRVKFSSLGIGMFEMCSLLGDSLPFPVVLPKGITIIEQKAFNGCVNLHKVVLPEGLEEVRESAFMGCAELKEAKLPATVRVIETGAFAKCACLVEINLHAEIERIDNYAFQDCRSISDTISLSKNLTLGEGVFYNCLRVPYYVVEAGNTTCSTLDGVLFNADKTALQYFPGGNRTILEYTIPASVKTILYGAFYGGGKMGEGLRKLVVPNTVTSIEDEAWIAFNLGIKEIVFEPGSQIKKIGGFYNSLYLEKLVLPSSLEVIDGGAFAWTSIEDLVIPESVTTVKAGAFIATAIDRLSFSKNLAFIEPRAFVECYGLSDISIASDNPNYTAVGGVVYTKDKKTLVVYPAGIAALSFTVPNGVETLAEGAFASNMLLEHLKVPSSVTTLEKATLYGCSGLKTVVLPDEIEAIPAGFCYGCSSLKSVNIPRKATEIGTASFSLGKVKKVSDTPFNEWELTLAENSTNEKPSVGTKMVWISEMNSVGAKAFNICYFDTLVVANKQPLDLPYGDDDGKPVGVFTPGCQASAVLMVPAGSLSAYQGADQWGDFSKIVEQRPVGVDDIEQLRRAITSVQGGVRLIADKHYLLTIYQISGATVKQQHVKEGELVVPLDKGAYVVQLGDYRKKIIVD